CLAGFMRVLSSQFVDKWQNRMINIHPSLLPKHKGATAIKDALEAKDKVTGCTVHFVVPEIDSGKIIIQREVLVDKNDDFESISQKMHKQKHIAYPEAIKKICLTS